MGGGSGRNLNPLLARVVEGDEHQGKVMAAIHFMLSVTNKHEEKVKITLPGYIAALAARTLVKDCPSELWSWLVGLVGKLDCIKENIYL